MACIRETTASSALQIIHALIELTLALVFFHCSLGFCAGLLMRWRLLAAINKSALAEHVRSEETAVSRQYRRHFVQQRTTACAHVRRTEIYDTVSETLFILQQSRVGKSSDKGYELEVMGFARVSNAQSHTLAKTSRSLLWDFCDDVLAAPETLWVDVIPGAGATQDRDSAGFGLSFKNLQLHEFHLAGNIKHRFPEINKGVIFLIPLSSYPYCPVVDEVFRSFTEAKLLIPQK